MVDLPWMLLGFLRPKSFCPYLIGKIEAEVTLQVSSVNMRATNEVAARQSAQDVVSQLIKDKAKQTLCRYKSVFC
ncbi:MAG: hypothetical protein ACOZBH_02325 [Patescibacteria group bacterium]